MKKPTSHLPNVQSLIDSDKKFARVFRQAKGNGLPKSQHANYCDVYLSNGNFDMGIATKMLDEDDDAWKMYLEECQYEIARMILGGENPRIKELGLDMTDVDEPKKKSRKTASKTKAAAKTKAPATTDGDKVSAKEGDAYRARVRLLCDEMDWELTETGGAITASDGETVVAQSSYVRGTKNNAWRAVAELLEVLT